ncbi:hypothetical protein Dimus_029753, partial [Dionaea muscipula]
LASPTALLLLLEATEAGAAATRTYLLVEAHQLPKPLVQIYSPCSFLLWLSSSLRLLPLPEL